MKCHNCHTNLQVFCLGNVTEDELTEGADEHGQEDSVSVHPTSAATFPAHLRRNLKQVRETQLSG